VKRPVIMSQHAMLRWLERGVGINMEDLRASIEASLAVAAAAAESIGGGHYLIVSGGLVYAVRDGVVTTVLDQKTARLPDVMRSTADA